MARAFRFFLAAAASTAVAAAAAALEPRVITVAIGSRELPAEVVRDFGSVDEGVPVVLELLVENASGTELRVGDVRPLCACMSEESVRSIPPGQSGRIAFRLETAGYSGPTTEAGMIQWFDATVPVTRAEMKLDVRPLLEITPRRLLRFRSTKGQEASDVLEIRKSDGTAFSVSKVETSSDFLHANVERLGVGYRLHATLTGNAPLGMLKGSVILHTDIARLPKLEVKVTGVVQAPKP